MLSLCRMDTVRHLKSAKSKVKDFSTIGMEESPSEMKKATLLAANHLLGQYNRRVREYILRPLSESELTTPNFAFCSSFLNFGDNTNCEIQKIQWRPTKNCDRNPLLLLELVNVIKSSLKSMKEKYIKELVFDSGHMNLILLNKSKVIGGITYRPFPQQGFTEVAFVAVFSGTHSKGCGKLLMDRLKKECIEDDILYLLTFGDNKALGFFEKQGFRSTIELPRENYQDYIKTYDNATLLECKLNPLFDYSILNKIFVAQKAIIDQMIIENLSKQKIAPKSICYTGEQKIVPLDFLKSVFPQCNFSEKLADFEDHSSQLKPKLSSVLGALKASAYNHFWEIKMDDVPKQLEHLPLRMDLQTICERVQQGYYCNLWTFHAEMAWAIRTLGAAIQMEPCIRDREQKLFQLKAFESLYCNELESAKLTSIINRRNIIVYSA